MEGSDEDPGTASERRIVRDQDVGSFDYASRVPSSLASREQESDYDILSHCSCTITILRGFWTSCGGFDSRRLLLALEGYMILSLFLLGAIFAPQKMFMYSGRWIWIYNGIGSNNLSEVVPIAMLISLFLMLYSIEISTYISPSDGISSFCIAKSCATYRHICRRYVTLLSLTYLAD